MRRTVAESLLCRLGWIVGVVAIENTADQRTCFVDRASQSLTIEEVAGVAVRFVVQTVADDVIEVANGAAFGSDPRFSLGVAKCRFDDEPLTTSTAITFRGDTVVFL